MDKKISLLALAAVVVALGAASALGAFSRGGAQAAATAPSSVNKVGVKVHGHWTLQVRTPAGRVVRTYRFHNDLFLPFAAGELTTNLIGSGTNGPWQVLLTGSPQACLNGNSCGISEPGAEPAGFQGHNTYNLTKTTISGGFRLRGSVVADQAGSIGNVHTYLSHCQKTVAPADCHGDNGWSRITQRVLPALVPVEAGQQVLATVDITFS
jgi:hypothetical protein